MWHIYTCIYILYNIPLRLNLKNPWRHHRDILGRHRMIRSTSMDVTMSIKAGDHASWRLPEAFSRCRLSMTNNSSVFNFAFFLLQKRMKLIVDPLFTSLTKKSWQVLGRPVHGHTYHHPRARHLQGPKTLECSGTWAKHKHRLSTSIYFWGKLTLLCSVYVRHWKWRFLAGPPIAIWSWKPGVNSYSWKTSWHECLQCDRQGYDAAKNTKNMSRKFLNAMVCMTGKYGYFFIRKVSSF